LLVQTNSPIDKPVSSSSINTLQNEQVAYERGREKTEDFERKRLKNLKNIRKRVRKQNKKKEKKKQLKNQKIQEKAKNNALFYRK
jgi:hypothetical protein